MATNDKVVTWTVMKAIRTAKNNTPFQYTESAVKYDIWIQDGTQVYTTEIWIDTSAVTGINVTQNNTDKTDWETNYKAGARGLVPTDVNVQNTVDVNAAVNVFAQTATVNVFKQAEFTAATRSEADVTGVTHTVATGKKLSLVWFGATGDSPAPMSFRLKVAGTTIMKINLGTGGGGNTSIYPIPVPVDIATAGQVVKITVEPAYKNATGWTGFIAGEIDA